MRRLHVSSHKKLCYIMQMCLYLQMPQYICVYICLSRVHSKLTVLHNLMSCSEENVHSITANEISHTLLYWMSTPISWLYCSYSFHLTGHKHWFSALLHLSLFRLANLFTVSAICTEHQFNWTWASVLISVAIFFFLFSGLLKNTNWKSYSCHFVDSDFLVTFLLVQL